MTGTWKITILVNDNFSISFKESKIGDKELYGTSYSMTEIEKLDISQKNVALDDIKVDYTGD